MGPWSGLGSHAHRNGARPVGDVGIGLLRSLCPALRIAGKDARGQGSPLETRYSISLSVMDGGGGGFPATPTLSIALGEGRFATTRECTKRLPWYELKKYAQVKDRFHGKRMQHSVVRFSGRSTRWQGGLAARWRLGSSHPHLSDDAAAQILPTARPQYLGFCYNVDITT